jgi:FkbM family methyltransferase
MSAQSAKIHTDFLHSVSFVDISLGLPYELLGFNLKRGMKVVDAGAHHGMYSIKASLLGSSGVVAIEPHPDNFQTLERNIAQNNVTNIATVNAALADHDGSVFLFESAHSGQHTIIPDLSVPFKSAMRIQCYTLDTLLSTLQFDPDIVKIDCEGAELPILQGAKQLLGRARSRKVVVEVHSESAAKVEACLKEFGFKTRTLVFNKPCVFAEKYT